MRPRISIRGLVRPLVGPSVRPLVGPSVALSSKSMKNGLLWIEAVLDEEERGRRRKEGRGGRRDEEEGATRRKERRGGRSDEEEGATRRVKK